MRFAHHTPDFVVVEHVFIGFLTFFFWFRMSPEFYRTELFLSHFNFGTTSSEFLILIFMFPTSFCYSLVCGNEKSFENYLFLNALYHQIMCHFLCRNQKSFENYLFLNALFVSLFELSFFSRDTILWFSSGWWVLEKRPLEFTSLW